MQLGFYCIYSQLVGLHLFHTFQLNFYKKRWVLQVNGKKTLVQSWWKLDGLYCSIFSPVSNCCTISDEYLHILLNIYLFIYLIHFGDGDREIIEAYLFSW
jgi:hypothetical protein